MHNRTSYARIGAPAAIVGVLAGALTATPADAAEAATTETGSVPVRTGTAPHAEARNTAPSARTAPAAAKPASYTVQSGDTVSTIAGRFGLPVADVLSWNGLGWRSVIYPGQKLTLSAPASSAATSSKPAAAPASSGAKKHTVVAGDTIFAIAQKNGTTVEALLTANGLGRDAIIYPGQTLVVGSATSASAAAPAPAAAPSKPAEKSSSSALNAPQAENAALIIRIGRELGVSDRGIAIALGTSMVESWLRNLDWGDRDSLGLFQQRPSTGWGTAAQISDREYSIRAFFTGVTNADGTSTRGLLDIPGWEKISFADAAQAVQISAYPDRYAAWEAAAYEWLAKYG